MTPRVECKQSTSIPNCIRQFGFLLLLLLKLKAWRHVFIVVPVLLLISNLYVLPWQMSMRPRTRTAGDGRQIVFYGTREFAAAQVKVLVDRSDEAKTSSLILASGDGSWIEDCRSETDCRERLIHQSDASVVAHLRYSSKSEQSRHVLDCLNEGNSHLTCAFIYQAMVQSAHLRPRNETAISVQLFEVHNFGQTAKPQQAEHSERRKNLSLPNSVCADWINSGELSRLTENGTPFTVSLAAFGVTFYLLISTVSCVHILKSEGFLQQQFQCGLSVSAYWLVVWLFTLIECLVFAGVFMVSHAMQCPGLYSAAAIAQMYFFVTLFSLNLSALLLLLEMLLPSMLLVSIVAIKINLGLVLAFSFSDYLAKKAPYVLYFFPPMFAKEYVARRMNSAVEQLWTEMSIGEDDALRFSNILAANLVSLLLQILLLVYLDFLLKTGNGLRLAPYYPVTAEFWFPRNLRDESVGTKKATESEPHIEPVMRLNPVVVVEELSKSYSNVCLCCSEAPIVLNKLSCTIYRGQITALIGHNGAGKSTLIRILTGEELPDEGTAHIGGCLVTNPLLRLPLRGRISTCPQFDALCNSLTVMECIRVTLVSRAASDTSDTSQLERARGMLQRLGLGDKEDVLSCDLSGGQKRKVSTILALLGDPDVVFLDEPTSGLDPVSRRQLWQLLQEEKSARSIILCTQFMDEADILADRKIFLCGGKIVCAGSSMFLKRAFGCSFTLNVSLKSQSDVESLLAKLNEVHVKSLDETELQLEVPALNSSVLTEAVQVLETSSEVETFGLSHGSLDGIFMRLGGMDSREVIKAFRAGTLMLPQLLETSSLPVESTPEKEEKPKHRIRKSNRMRGSTLVQFIALFALNMKRQVRSRANLVSRILVPAALLAVMAFAAALSQSTLKQKTDDPEFHKMDILAVPQSFRINFFGKSEIPITCVSDGVSNPISLLDCESLALPAAAEDSGSRPPILIKKSPSQSLEDFLSLKSTRDEIFKELRAKNWIKGGARMTPCAVYYASPWQKNVSNKDRSVSVGVLYQEDSLSPKVHIYRRALVTILKFFGISGPEATTALASTWRAGAFNISRGIQFFTLLFVFCLFPVSYLSDPIEDMAIKARNYLASTGLTSTAYWVNTFLMHWVQYVICYMIAVGLLLICEEYRSTYIALAAFLPVLLAGTVSNQLTIYAIAVVTQTQSTVVSTACVLTAVLLPPVLFLTQNHKTFVTLLVWILPPAAPLELLYSSANYYFLKLDYYQTNDGDELPGMAESVYRNPLILQSLLAMPVHIFIMFGIIFFTEHSAVIRKLIRGNNAQITPDNIDSEMEEGAKKEAERVLAAPRGSKNVLEVRQLQKIYPNGVHAVRGVTFGSMAGEIFGLLGANGAGKSTSMSVIVGEEVATEGVCEVRMQDGAWLTGRGGAAVGAIGYCPQYNPLFNRVTVAEHIRFYADIRGLDSIEAERQTIRLMQSLGLSQHSDKQAGQLSGGNKRRLCLAIALLGNPALIVIDEASTGVDPENKRFIWGAIRRMVRKKRSVMVTTHSMEEVEALCSRVGIMNKGRMISVGTVQQLRSRHGDAYTLELLLNAESETSIRRRKLSIKTAVLEQFSGAHTQEDVGLSLVMQFSVPKSSVSSLSDALKWLETNQSGWGVSYWAFYQMSLDQVFVKLIKTHDLSAPEKTGNSV